MSETFVWTPEYTKRFFELRFKNEQLFQQRKQPWAEFHALLIKEGFPEEMTIDHVRKKWTYTYESYQISKKSKNENWKYYELFESHFGNRKIFDKYSCWNEEWRNRLIDAVIEAKTQKLENDIMWRTVETKLRSQDLPIDCCIQDIKPLFHSMIVIFNRKQRKAESDSKSVDWPHYEIMLKYNEIEDKYGTNKKKKSIKMFQSNNNNADCEDYDFQWSKDITETFINIRLQHDWLFKHKAGRWKELCAIMIEDYGFPKYLTPREISRKWASTFSEYQKAKATNYTSYCYYNLFETHFNSQKYTLNPLKDWSEEWVKCLIEAKIKAELSSDILHSDYYNEIVWREVEKHLRIKGLPIENSFFDLEDIWGHLVKTFRLKRKFVNQGISTDQDWAYYALMTEYTAQSIKLNSSSNKNDIKKTKIKKKKIDKESIDVSNTDVDFSYDFDSDDDVKLFDLKKTKIENKISCRSCLNGEGSIDIFYKNGNLDIAYKLMRVTGLEVLPTDELPKQICVECARALDSAYNFIDTSKMADIHYRNIKNTTKEKIKNEIEHDFLDIDPDIIDYELNISENEPKINYKIEGRKKKLRRMDVVMTRTGRKKYIYKFQVCDICGKDTRDIKKHLLIHSSEKKYSCEFCGKKFKFKSGLYSHKLSHNPQKPKKTCEVCGKSFTFLAGYRKHYAVHKNERKFACDTCGKAFKSMDVLKVHMFIHTGERRFSCPDCGKSFRTSGCVARHRRIVHKKVKEKDVDE